MTGLRGFESNTNSYHETDPGSFACVSYVAGFIVMVGEENLENCEGIYDKSNVGRSSQSGA